MSNVIRKLGNFLPITALTAGFMGPLAAAATQPSDAEEIAIIWEIDGEAYCAWTPPEGIENGFQFNFSRWSSSATNSGPLALGDPMVLTYSFLPDGGPQGALFDCGVPGEIPGAPSILIAFLDGLHGAGPGGPDLTMRPWFPIFKSAFDNWGSSTGIKYVYEPMDDGAPVGLGSPGVLGVRGDLRIGGHFMDGQAGPNVLACNYFPDSGEMIIDTGNTSFYGPSPPENRGFRNVLEHEHGHGLAFSHVCPLNQTKLMEPFVATTFLGLQEDELRAGNRGYGDRDEFPAQNDTSGTATSLGAIAAGGSVMRTALSIDGIIDQDFYSFSASAGTRATVSVKPTGTAYLEGPQTMACDNTGTSIINALIENNLGVELRGQSGANILATANSAAAGVEEKIMDAALTEGAGTYFVRIFGAQDKVQMYDLTVSLSTDSADLSISKSDSPDPVFTGRTLTYTNTVHNNGPGTATGVTVTETLPAGVTFVSTSGCTEDPNGVATCTLGTIAPGASKSYTVVVTVTAGPGSISNKVDVASTSTDPNAANNSFTEATTVVPAPTCVTDIILTAANNGSSSGYGAKNTITTGGGFAVGAAEKVNFTAGISISFGNDTSLGGEVITVIDPTVCP